MSASQSDNGAPSGGDRRLDAWKEIARYLDRDVRTVQRWEQYEGLPVHRHHHQKRGSVYAYAAEIDRWRASRNLPDRHRYGIRWAVTGAVVASLLALLYLGNDILRGPTTGGISTPNPEAHRYVRIGEEYMRNRTSPQDDHSAARAAFEKAILTDPSYAPAYGGLALARATQSTQVMGRADFSEAIEAAEDALSMDPQLADAHVALGIVYLQQGRTDAAHQALHEALTLEPDHADGGYWLSVLLREQGEFDDSDRQLIRSLEADPLHPLLNTAYAKRLWARGEFQPAVTHLERVLEAPDPPADVLWNLSAIHREYGDLVGALYWAKETAKANPRFNGLHALIVTYSILDMHDEADFWYQQLRMAEGDGPPRLGIHSQYLYLSGDIEASYQLKTQYLETAGVPLEQLPFAVRETFGGMAILSGRIDEGISVMQDLFGDELRIPEHLGGSDIAMTFAQILAYAYQQTERYSETQRICELIDSRINALRKSHSGYSPSFFVVQARNLLLRGDHERAIATLKHAADLGWRNYVFERQLPIWKAVENHPDYVELMEQVSADVAMRRDSIEADGNDTLFADSIIGLLSR